MVLEKCIVIKYGKFTVILCTEMHPKTLKLLSQNPDSFQVTDERF